MDTLSDKQIRLQARSLGYGVETSKEKLIQAEKCHKEQLY